MTKEQEKKFLQIAVGVTLVVWAIFGGLSIYDRVTENYRQEQLAKAAEEAAKAAQEEAIRQSRIGVITDGENAGQEVDMSDALLIQDMVEGTGAEVKAGDRLLMHYHGTLEDGTVFDSSVDRGEPFEVTIGVGQVIQGWDDGVPGMKVGGKRKLTIPAHMAYGDQARGAIPANSRLIFDVEVLEILP